MFFINGRILTGAQPYEKFKELIDEELIKAENMFNNGNKKENIYYDIMKKALKKVE